MQCGHVRAQVDNAGTIRFSPLHPLCTHTLRGSGLGRYSVETAHIGASSQDCHIPSPSLYSTHLPAMCASIAGRFRSSHSRCLRVSAGFILCCSKGWRFFQRRFSWGVLSWSGGFADYAFVGCFKNFHGMYPSGGTNSPCSLLSSSGLVAPQ